MKAAKSFIEAELAKYGTWEEYLSSACRGQLTIEAPQTFTNLKEKGVGIGTIHAFLGKQWSRYLIENTLSVIRQEEDVERKRVEACEADCPEEFTRLNFKPSEYADKTAKPRFKNTPYRHTEGLS